ncbi:MAG: YihA family ribosome biogenesis GTP-binding protein [Flavobacteriaceae bacterium]|nr:YihA family ribosome biogenesis GTP-binding protein [Flavobacteriaceae bacterium]
MYVKSARFVISNTDIEKCPNNNLPEYAFIGRSNVGKSSLINSICNKKALAKTSSKPGKTQLINHYLINNKWFLVDLPGYGYANASKTKKEIFQSFITTYFIKRKQLINAFLLIDIRHEPQKIDVNFMRWLGNNQIPFSIIFTKSDKLKTHTLNEKLNNYKQIMIHEVWESLPPIFVTSSLKNKGGEDILNYIDNLNSELS